ncbi:MAG TPA: beta-N-acetylhexosaminidase [Thermoflexales bacterium]|nr:beta-N-acetylhexosaminidase [Thermoflexales bacterium]
MRLIPNPASLDLVGSGFSLSSNTVIACPPALRAEAEMLAGWLRPATGFSLAIVANTREGDVIELGLSENLGHEAYILEATPERVSIQAGDAAGAFYAGQTLRQLLPAGVFTAQPIAKVAWMVPGVRIADAPRFGWRGSHLDVSRHFMPVAFIKKHLDLLALHKMNVFHWHLTDDQGWRFEVRKYPRLTEVGAWRATTRLGHEYDKRDLFDGIPHGGFYTQAEVGEIVAYAAARHILVLPEFDMPGHMMAAIAAYPELGNLDAPAEVWPHWGISKRVLNISEETIAFAQDVLSEALELFPSKYIHLGGDECPRDEWVESPRMQAFMRAQGMTDEAELQAHFMKRMDAFLSERGRVLVGWDEILEGGLAPNAVVMSWRGEQGGITAAQAGHDVVMAPYHTTYFDYYQSEDRANEPLAIGNYTSVEKVCAYEPIPANLDPAHAGHVLGAQCQLWTEYTPTPAAAEYMLYPRLCAFAEAVWTPKARRDADELLKGLKAHQHRLALLDVAQRLMG